MTLMELVIGLAITSMMTAAGAGAFESLISHRKVIRDASVSTERAVARSSRAAVRADCRAARRRPPLPA
jgi:Tfp pilus assembly protein FimT